MYWRQNAKDDIFWMLINCWNIEFNRMPAQLSAALSRLKPYALWLAEIMDDRSWAIEKGVNGKTIHSISGVQLSDIVESVNSSLDNDNEIWCLKYFTLHIV